MKTLITFSFILFLNLSCLAHKDKVIRNTYGNVKVLLKTGFDYSEIYKVDIIGKLSNELAQNLKFKDTLFIEYINDYTKIYDRNIYSFENNNTSFKFLAGLRNMENIRSNGRGISLRIYGQKIEIENILKLVEYCLTNRKTLNSKLVKEKVLPNYVDDYQSEELYVDLIPKTLMTKIISKNYARVTKLMNTRIEVYKQQQPYGIEITWENNRFIFSYKNFDEQREVLLEIKDFFYSKEVDLNTMLVFIDEESFYYLEAGEKTDSTLFKLSNKSYRPVETINRFNNKIIISNDYNSMNIFLKDKKKLITKIE